MPIIPCSQEVERKGSWFQVSQGKKISETPPISENKLGVVAHVCDSSGDREIEVKSEAAPGQKHKSLSEK
jgi:hypothetical protein